MTDTPVHPLGHPSPRRDKRTIVVQLAGVAAGPLAWAAQLEIGYALTAYACHPGDLALSGFAPGWGWTRGASLAVNGVALLFCLGLGALCWRAWRLARNGAPDPRLHALDRDEGRPRFLVFCAALTSFGFAVAVVFDTVMLLGSPACRA